MAISSRSRERVETAAGEIGATGYAHDNSDIDGAADLVDRVESDLGPVDVLVVNTGGPPGNPDPLGFTRDQWTDAHRELVLSPMALIERVLPGKRARLRAHPEHLLERRARADPDADAFELAPPRPAGRAEDDRVAGGPGRGDGQHHSSRAHRHWPDRRELRLARGGRGGARGSRSRRPPRPRGELAAMAAFLCSEPAGYITGTAILVDGGLTRSL